MLKKAKKAVEEEIDLCEVAEEVAEDVAEEVTLKGANSKRFVKVTYPGMKYVGFWHKPKTEAPYVCIEPWMSVPADDGKVDDLETKRDMYRLASGGVNEQSFTITIG